MLIGNRERVAIELSSVEPSWERRYAPEAASWAGFAFWVEGKNLCAHVREGEEGLRTAFYVPLAPLADWLVRSYPALSLEERATWFPTSRRLHEMVRSWGDRPPPAELDEEAWLDAREAFWARHFLVAGADGARVPNVALLREDDDVLVAWAAPHFASAPRVTMLHADGLSLQRWGDLASVLARFADVVAADFARTGIAVPYRWMTSSQVLSVGADRALVLALFCARGADALAKLFGVPESALEGVLGTADAPEDPAASPVCQMVRDLPPAPSSGIAAELLATVRAARAGQPEARARWLGGRDVALDAARAGEAPEAQGQLAASAVRTELRRDGEPIASVSEVLAAFGVSQRSAELWTSSERMLVAVASEGAPAATILRTRRTETVWGARFEQMRALGHALLDPLRSGAIGAASTRYAQEARRRRSGAFAAELLLPASALELASGGRLDGAASAEVFGDVLERYGVGARTAAHQLFNHGWLSGTGVREELIERFARE